MNQISRPLLPAILGLASALPVIAEDAPISIEKAGKGGKGSYVVRVGDKPFTTLLCGELVSEAGVPTPRSEIVKYRGRPVFYPVYGPDGVRMTRDYPFSKETKGEAHDHPHHESLWYSHGDVNGIDFWHVGEGKGRIRQTGRQIGEDTIWMSHDWVGPDRNRVCEDLRTMKFSTLPGGARVIDFKIELTASDGELTFGDTKEGTMAIRSTPDLRIDKGAVASNSADDRGKAIWGKAAKWVNYQKGDAGFAIFDHPTNPRHPTTWHARDYGLVAANPFGAHHFSGAVPGAGDLVLKPDESVTFRYAFVFHRGKMEKKSIEDLYTDWSKKK